MPHKMGRFAKEFVIITPENFHVVDQALGLLEAGYGIGDVQGALIEYEIDENSFVPGEHPSADDDMEGYRVVMLVGYPSRLFLVKLPDYLHPLDEGLVQATPEEWEELTRE